LLPNLSHAEVSCEVAQITVQRRRLLCCWKPKRMRQLDASSGCASSMGARIFGASTRGS
jgi:hypothetical protein